MRNQRPVSTLPHCAICGSPAHLLVPCAPLVGVVDLAFEAKHMTPTCWPHFRGKHYREPPRDLPERRVGWNARRTR